MAIARGRCRRMQIDRGSDRAPAWRRCRRRASRRFSRHAAPSTRAASSASRTPLVGRAVARHLARGQIAQADGVPRRRVPRDRAAEADLDVVGMRSEHQQIDRHGLHDTLTGCERVIRPSEREQIAAAFVEIRDRPVALRHGSRSQRRLLPLARRHEMDDLPSPCQHVVGDEPPVALPPDRLGAHDRRRTFGREPLQVERWRPGTRRSRRNRRNSGTPPPARACCATGGRGARCDARRAWEDARTRCRRLRDRPGSVSILNCGCRRERGMRRTSARRVTPASCSIPMSSGSGRVECPMVYRTPTRKILPDCRSALSLARRLDRGTRINRRFKEMTACA